MLTNGKLDKDNTERHVGYIVVNHIVEHIKCNYQVE